MFNLVSIAEARSHLRIDEENESDAAVLFFISSASSAVLKRIKAPRNAANAQDVWGVDAVPDDVRMATLLVIGDLYDNRASGTANPFSDAVKALLDPYYFPTWA